MSTHSQEELEHMARRAIQFQQELGDWVVAKRDEDPSLPFTSVISGLQYVAAFMTLVATHNNLSLTTAKLKMVSELQAINAHRAISSVLEDPDEASAFSKIKG